MMNAKQSTSVLGREDIGGVTVLRFRLPTLREDEPTQDAFNRADQAVEAGRSRLVLNLDGVGFVASAALGRLVTLLHKARAAHGRLVLCNVTRAIEELLRATRLADVLLTCAGEREAVQAFA